MNDIVYSKPFTHVNVYLSKKKDRKVRQTSFIKGSRC